MERRTGQGEGKGQRGRRGMIKLPPIPGSATRSSVFLLRITEQHIASRIIFSLEYNLLPSYNERSS